MTKIFLICGYEIPEDMTKDFEYKVYMNLAFNKIYDYAVRDQSQSIVIIFSGGNTDSFPPYKRNEASEMIKLFKSLMGRSFVKDLTEKWQMVVEKRALSTLENLLFAKEIIAVRKVRDYKLHIICSLLREGVIERLGQEVFGKSVNWQVNPLDFQNSPKRYVDPKTRITVEKEGIEFALWALKSPENMGKFRSAYKEKLELTRRNKDISYEDKVKWWGRKLRELGFEL
ncbi:hypothetical protein IID22_01660 [Patescibacteria group bacterium]|nr:hypothetical protein [Patescibacteria group bacterium]